VGVFFAVQNMTAQYSIPSPSWAKDFLDVITHGVINYSPLIGEHPAWFKGESWGMTDFDWYGGHSDLDDWWVKTYTDYVTRYGVDGFRLDVNMYRPELWNGGKKELTLAGLKKFSFTVKKDHTAGGGISIFKIEWDKNAIQKSCN
jgi:uncharacterized lipoprotein YddW (UPF0748 family)